MAATRSVGRSHRGDSDGGWALRPPRSIGPREYDRVLGVECVCNVGVQECPIHPGRLRTQEERVAFRKAFDERVAAGQRREETTDG